MFEISHHMVSITMMTRCFIDMTEISLRRDSKKKLIKNHRPFLDADFGHGSASLDNLHICSVMASMLNYVLLFVFGSFFSLIGTLPGSASGCL